MPLDGELGDGASGNLNKKFPSGDGVPGGDAEIPFTVVRPCAADLFPAPTGDGVLNSDDVLMFVNEFNAGQPGSDLFPPPLGDGVFNADDVIEFVNAFNAGCP